MSLSIAKRVVVSALLAVAVLFSFSYGLIPGMITDVTDDYQKVPDRVLTAKEAGQLLQLTPQTVISLCANDKIPGAKVGGRWRFSWAELIGLVTTTAVATPRRKIGDLPTEQFDALVRNVTRGCDELPKRRKPAQ